MELKTVTRADLVETVAQKTKLPRAEAAKIVSGVFTHIERELVRGRPVKLSRFGNFMVRQKNQRIGRNPKTGREVPITPRTVVTFRPSQLLKDRVEKGKPRAKKQR
ncbi:MAG: integration host factor subunit alpha [Alphaproteobacteria bacterium]|nr:integration host factor subunit alpha [Alphaproteobacteria bacterium]